jgi:catechol 2,3-dioxygenase-like lactoylglutathione lyase family enzyme
MLDHVTIGVNDFARSRAFYDNTLTSIGIDRLHGDDSAFAGYGADQKAFFWIGLRRGTIIGVHIAFAVADRALVERFHAVGLVAGGRDNGKPGLRPQYHPNYYGAFILDPDGHNVEAVCRGAV